MKNLISRCVISFIASVTIISCNASNEQEGYIVPKETPAIADFNADLDKISNMLSSQCYKASPAKPASVLPNTTSKQLSISCHLIEYYGAERNADFVFLDEKLVYVSFAIDFEDVPYLIKHKVDQFQNADFENEKAVFFEKGSFVLNKEKPTAIYFSPLVSDHVKTKFDIK